MTNRPNILFFHMDNTGVGDWGAYGGAYPLGAKTVLGTSRPFLARPLNVGF